ncbi:MAG TPA: hypothetical protein VF941_03355 [Clostridia bacterium]
MSNDKKLPLVQEDNFIAYQKAHWKDLIADPPSEILQKFDHNTIKELLSARAEANALILKSESQKLKIDSDTLASHADIQTKIQKIYGNAK